MVTIREPSDYEFETIEGAAPPATPLIITDKPCTLHAIIQFQDSNSNSAAAFTLYDASQASEAIPANKIADVLLRGGKSGGYIDLRLRCRGLYATFPTAWPTPPQFKIIYLPNFSE